MVVARSGPGRALFPSEDVFERQLTSEKTSGVDRASGPVSTIDPADDEAGGLGSGFSARARLGLQAVRFALGGDGGARLASKTRTGVSASGVMA